MNPSTTSGDTSMSPLKLAHLDADHRLAAGDTSDLLPGINAAQAIVTARRIIESDYHDGCPTCARETAAAAKPVHTKGGSIIGDPSGKYPTGLQYGQTHDMDCPGCANTPFTASPRSETYWAS